MAAAFTGEVTPFGSVHTVDPKITQVFHSDVHKLYRPQKNIQVGKWAAYSNKGRAQAGECVGIIPTKGRRKGYIYIKIPGLEKHTKLNLSRFVH